jgi:outer membrane murein-binding lipoprotein Lpp
MHVGAPCDCSPNCNCKCNCYPVAACTQVADLRAALQKKDGDLEAAQHAKAAAQEEAVALKARRFLLAGAKPPVPPTAGRHGSRTVFHMPSAFLPTKQF